MPVLVSMHACSVWPINVDFAIYQCYIDGYSPEETAEVINSQLCANLSAGQCPCAPASKEFGHSCPDAEGSVQPSQALLSEDARVLRVSEEEEEICADGVMLDASTLATSAITTRASASSLADGCSTSVTENSVWKGPLAIAGSAEVGASGHDATTTNAAAAAAVAGGYSAKRSKQAKHNKQASRARKGKATSPAIVEQQSQKFLQRSEQGGAHAATCPHQNNFFLCEDYLRFQRMLQKPQEEKTHMMMMMTALGASSSFQQGVSSNSNGTGAAAAAPTAGVTRHCSTSAGARLLLEEVIEQFHFFDSLAQDDYLRTPYSFLSSQCIHIRVKDRLRLVEMYYEVDPAVFRLFFGEKLTRFDMSDFLNKSFTTSWWSNWAPLAEREELPLQEYQDERFAQLRKGSLRRQWENMRLVCTSLAAMYRGKGGLLIQRRVPLSTAIKRCYGLRGRLAVHYGTQVFGYEHRLTGKLFARLHSFDDYTIVCNLLAAAWCDESLLLLSAAFVHGCDRVVQLLEDSRVMGELHQVLFGEAVRPRWQLQLDEVQRAIITTNAAEKSGVMPAVGSTTNAASTITAAVVTTQYQQQPQQPVVVAPPNSFSAVPTTNVPHSLTASCNAAAACAAAVGSNVTVQSNSCGVYHPNGASSPNALQTAAPGVNSVFCANRNFSRRFMHEFPNLMKYFIRIAAHVSSNGNVSDALDTFYVRVFLFFESLSTRAGPAAVSYVLNTTASAAAAAVPSPAAPAFPVHTNSPLGAPQSALISTQAASLHEDISQTARSVLAAGDGSIHRSPGTTNEGSARQHSLVLPSRDANTSLSSGAQPLDQRTSSNLSITDMDRSYSFGINRAASGNLNQILLPVNSHSLAKPFSVPFSGNDDDVELDQQQQMNPSFIRGCAEAAAAVEANHQVILQATTVVNSSMMPSISALLPPAVGTQRGSPTGVRTTMSTASGGEGPLGSGSPNLSFAFPKKTGTLPAGGAATVNSTASPIAVSIVSALPGNPAGPPFNSSLFSPNVVGSLVPKAVDKHYLKELCLLFNVLPRAWQQLATVSAEDHAESDATVSNFVLALKGITQVLMAADDFV